MELAHCGNSKQPSKLGRGAVCLGISSSYRLWYVKEKVTFTNCGAVGYRSILLTTCLYLRGVFKSIMAVAANVRIWKNQPINNIIYNGAGVCERSSPASYSL